MRRLSMKNKRKKSETVSDCESEENGVSRTATVDDAGESDENQGKTDTTERTPVTRKNTARKRNVRGRLSQKAQSEEEPTEANDTDGDEEENGSVGKGGAGKRRKTDEQRASTSANEESTGNEKEYEVEKIVGQRTIKGRRQFLVRWRGYDEDADTWEHEKSLNCTKLIEKFLAEEQENHEEEEEDIKSDMSAKGAKSKIAKKEPKKSKRTKNNDKEIKADTDLKNDKDGMDDNQKEFEVEKIIEVRFKKNKTREFLIRWKGFSSADDTWEPEKNLNCPELIEKFMQKVEKAKATEMRELRTNRPHTKRYTVATPEIGRRLSRRNMDKQRATYHECDE